MLFRSGAFKDERHARRLSDVEVPECKMKDYDDDDGSTEGRR